MNAEIFLDSKALFKYFTFTYKRTVTSDNKLTTTKSLNCQSTDKIVQIESI